MSHSVSAAMENWTSVPSTSVPGSSLIEMSKLQLCPERMACSWGRDGAWHITGDAWSALQEGVYQRLTEAWWHGLYAGIVFMLLVVLVAGVTGYLMRGRSELD